jgi:N-acetylmuramoyl-L-alanine amidase
VLKPQIVLLASLLLFAGCSSGTRTRVPDWKASAGEAPMELEHVADSPEIAAPIEIVPPPPPVRTNLSFADTWIPLQRWSRENKVGTVTQVSVSPRIFSLSASNGTLLIQIRNLAARWNGIELRLGFEPQLIDEQPYVHVLDLKKNIEPLLTPFAVTTKSNRVLVIDPGHGGGNGGTVSVLDGTNEKVFTLDWALRIESLLSTNGWRVFLTRTNDIELPLPARIAIADARNADLFISLHFNSAGSRKEQAGVETFCLTPVGMRSTLTREYEDNPALVFTNNSFDALNLQYSMRLHKALLETGNLTDRGVRRARFLGVLRGQNRPAVLLEGGYLSNPDEARRIADPEFRQKLAEAVVRALSDPPAKNERTLSDTNAPPSIPN